MATLAEFKKRFGILTATKGLDETVLDVYIENALIAFAEHNPERVLMKKVPVDRQANGFYDVPSDAEAVISVFVHNTEIEIEFQVEQDAKTGVEQIRLGAIQRPSTIFISGDYDPVASYYPSGSSLEGGYGRGVEGGYDFFDIEYDRTPAVERLSDQDLYTLQLYVEYLGYTEEASKTDNLVDITDADSSGDSTTLRKSNIGRQWQSLANGKMKAFEMRAIRPYAARRRTRRFEYYYGHPV